MATANHLEDNITVSSKAVELLGCFADELDTVILEMAQDVARTRLGQAEKSDEPIEIEADDVKAAAGAMLSALKERIEQGRLPQHLKEAVDAFEKCFQRKCQEG